MKCIEKDIECQSCDGTGVYTGMAENGGAAVVCRTCKGTGKYHYKFEYKEFTGLKKREDIKRVYISGYGYGLAPKKINFDKVGEVDLTKEGVSYEEFLEGKRPEHIRSFGCPMMCDQGACYRLDGFTKKCYEKGLSAGGYFTDCKYFKNRDKCWDLFDQSVDKEEDNE